MRSKPNSSFDGSISRLTGEFFDRETERLYWARMGEEQATWGSMITVLALAMILPLGIADYLQLGPSLRLGIVLLIRVFFAIATGTLWHLLRTTPRIVRHHGYITAAEAAAVMCFAVLVLAESREISVNHTQMALVMLSMFIVVPNRLPNVVAVTGFGSIGWLTASAMVHRSSAAEIITQGCAFGAVLAFGFVSAIVLNVTRRREFLLRREAEASNEALRAEIARREAVERVLLNQAVTDPLTTLGNRRQFEERAGLEFSRSRRSGEPLSLVVIDVDHFKSINDAHGHAAGDKVLVQLGKMLTQYVRKVDTVCRLGGEEFAVIMPGADLGRAEEVADRMRRLVSGVAVEVPTGVVCLTVSVGVTQCDVWVDRVADALARADDAMYSAKVAGRDRVAVA